MTVIGLLVLLALLGVAYYFVGQMEFIAQPFKKLILAVLVAIAAVALIIWAAALFGYTVPFRLR